MLRLNHSFSLYKKIYFISSVGSVLGVRDVPASHAVTWQVTESSSNWNRFL
jgi:hypothetical protein